MKVQTSIRSTFLAILITVIGGCSQQFAFKKSSAVPAAEVNVEISQDNNENYKIELDVKNLAQPQDLTPARETYVAWIISPQGTYNIGRLSVNQKLKGSLTATSPYQPTLVKITAEDRAKTTQPGTQVVLTSEQIIFK